MTTSSVTPAIAFAGTSSPGNLGPFSLIKSGTSIASDDDTIHVLRYSTVTDTEPSVLVEDTDFTRSTDAITLTSPQTGLLTTERLFVFREGTIEQLLDLVAGGSFSAEALEARFDEITKFVAEVSRKADTAVRLTPFSTDALPDNVPMEAAIDKIMYLTGTAAAPEYAFIENPDSLLTNTAALVPYVESIEDVAADLTGADTIGTVAADLAGDDDIGTVSANIADIIAAAAAIGDLAAKQNADATLTGIAGIDVADGDHIEATGTDTFRARKLFVDTKSDLAAIENPQADDVITVLGRTAAGDGGGGVFRVVSDTSGNVTAALAADPGEGIVVALTNGGGTKYARRIQRSDDVVDVLWFLATDTDAGRLAAGQAAVAWLAANRPTGGVILIPQYFKISGNWVIEEPNIVLKGSGRAHSYIISADTDAPALTFQPETAGVSSGFLDNCGIRDLSVGYSSGDIGVAGSVALWVRQCQQFEAKNFRTFNAEVTLLISGGQFNRFDHWLNIGQANSTALKAESEDIGGGNFQTAYTCQFSNIILAGGSPDYAIDINSADGFTFDQGYIAFHDEAHIRLFKTKADAIGHISFSNIYFDGVDAALAGGISPAHLLTVPAHAYGNSGTYIHFENCSFANVTGDLWDIQEDLVGVKVSNSTFLNSTGWAVNISGVGTGDFTFIGCKFRNLGTAATSGAIRCAGTLNSLILIGNDFEFNEYRQVDLSGTIENFVSIGNAYRGTTPDIVSSATITRQVVLDATNSSSPFGKNLGNGLDFSTLGTIERLSTNGDISLEPNGSGLVKIGGAGARTGSLVSVLTGAHEGALIQQNAIQLSKNGGPSLYLRRTASDGTIQQFYRDTTAVGSISVTGSATAYNTSSDYRRKPGAVDLDPLSARNHLMSLRPRSWHWDGDGEEGWGFIAHEYAESSPAAVTGEKDGDVMQTMTYADPKTIAAMVREIQSLRRELDALKGEASLQSPD